MVNNIKQITVDINKLDPEKFPNICKLLEDYRIINFFKKNDLINNSKIFGRLERIKLLMIILRILKKITIMTLSIILLKLGFIYQM